MTTTTTKVNGVLLSLLLIVSLGAIGAIGTAGAASDGEVAIAESVDDGAGAQSYEQTDVASGEVPDYEVGDVNEDGEIGIQDVILTQQYVAGMNPEPFNENLADANRDDEVSISDVILVQRRAVNLAGPGVLEISGVDAPDEATVGTPFTVDVSLENTGDVGTIQHVNVSLAADESDLDPEDPAASGVGDLGSGETTTLELEVDPGQTGDLYLGAFTDDDDATDTITVSDGATGHVSGTVTEDVLGEPVEGVTVEVDAADGVHETTTDDSGQFTVEAAAGEATVSFLGEGFENETVDVTVPEDGTAITDVTLVQKPASISGTITASDTGEPITGASVIAQNGLGDTFQTTTDEDGEYTVDDLYAGTYSILVDHEDYRTENVVHVDYGEDVENVDLSFAPEPGTITGQVVNVHGQPLSDATVKDDHGAFETTTNETGHFEIENVARGEYALRASHDAWGVDSGPVFVEVEPNEVTTANPSIGTFFEVENFEAPDEAHLGDTIEVSADVTNVGSVIAERQVTYWPPGTNMEDPSANIATETIELKPDETRTVEFEYTIENDSETGAIEHGISADELVSDTINVIDPDDPQPEFDLGGIEGAEFDRGETYERTANFTPGDGYDANAEYTLQLEVVDPDGERINLSAEDEFTINDVFIPSLGGDAGLIEDDDEAGVFYLDETATGADLNDAGEDEPADVNATVDGDATTGTYTFTVGLVETDGEERTLVGGTESATFDVAESSGGAAAAVVSSALALPAR